MQLQLDMGWGADEEGGDFYNPDGIKEGGWKGGREGGREGGRGRGGKAGAEEKGSELLSANAFGGDSIMVLRRIV